MRTGDEEEEGKGPERQTDNEGAVGTEGPGQREAEAG